MATFKILIAMLVFWTMLTIFSGLCQGYASKYPPKALLYMVKYVHYVHFRALEFPMILRSRISPCAQSVEGIWQIYAVQTPQRKWPKTVRAHQGPRYEVLPPSYKLVCKARGIFEFQASTSSLFEPWQRCCAALHPETAAVVATPKSCDMRGRSPLTGCGWCGMG